VTVTDPEGVAVERARRILRPQKERARDIGGLLHALLSRRDNAEAECRANLYDAATEPYMVVESIQTPDGPMRVRRPILEDDGEAEFEVDGEKKSARSYRQDIEKCEAGIDELVASTDPEVLKAAERMIDDGEFDPEKDKGRS